MIFFLNIINVIQIWKLIMNSDKINKTLYAMQMFFWCDNNLNEFCK